MSKLKVYLAGSIGPTDWRHKVVRDLRDAGIQEDSITNISTLPRLLDTVSRHIACTGPFFVACDHSCGHGPQSHGVALTGRGCLENGTTRDAVLVANLRRILDADVMLACIDKADAYGTVSEIGYAHALGKPIIAAVNVAQAVADEHWFPLHMCSVVEYAGPVEMFNALHTFVEGFYGRREHLVSPTEKIVSSLHDQSRMKWKRSWFATNTPAKRAPGMMQCSHD